MRINSIDEINDSDEILEQKQEGEENKGLEEEKESGLYPTENLERRKFLRLDKIKENILTIGIKGGMSIDEIDYLVDFILNDNEGFISTSFNKCQDRHIY